MHFVWHRKTPGLDVLLWFHRDVHVLLRPLADLRVRDPALRPVSHVLVELFYDRIITHAVV